MSEFVSKLPDKVVENFILLCLCLAILVAFSYPSPGSRAADIQSGKWRIIEVTNNIMVFLLSGLTLKIEDLKHVFDNKYLVIYGLVSINLLTTLAAFVMVLLPFPTSDFSIGLAIFSTVPTTLGVGVALTQLSKGDFTLSLFLTIASNMLGIVTIPYLLGIYLEGFGSVQLDPLYIAYRLSITVLLPSIAGIGLRRLIPAVKDLTKTYKSSLSMFSTFNLMMIVWMNLSVSRNIIFDQSGLEVFGVLVVVFIQHSFYLAAQIVFLTQILPFIGIRIPIKQSVSLIIMCSQKSSPVALSVIALVASGAGQRGLLTIPCILGQLTQIFMGSVLTRLFAGWVDAAEQQLMAASLQDSGHDGIDNSGDLVGDVELQEVSDVPAGKEESLLDEKESQREPAASSVIQVLEEGKLEETACL
eukprot:gene36039-43707_t